MSDKNTDQCVYLNVQGLLNNIDEIRQLIKSKKPSVIFLSETHLIADVENNEVNIKNYNVMRCDSHSTHTGGVAMYVKKNIRYHVSHQRNYENSVWSLTVKFDNKHLKGTYIILYRSPNLITDKQFLDYFELLSEEVVDHSQRIYICGDFNIDLLKRFTYSERVIRIIQSLGMKQLVRSPTRVTKDSRTLIEYVISNDYNTSVNVLLEEKISDHSTITFSSSSDRNCGHDNKKEMIEKLVKYSREDFMNELKKVDWDVSFDSVDESADYLIDNLKTCVNKFVKKVRVNAKDKTWYNDELRRQRMNRDSTYKVAFLTDRADHWEEHKKIAKEYSKNVKETRSNYYRNKLRLAARDPAKMWRTLKDIVNGVRSELPRIIDFNGITKSNDCEIANSLNKYFVDSIVDISDSIPTISDCMNVLIESAEPFEFKPATYENVKSVLTNIASKSDSEHLTKTVLIDALPVVGNCFVNVINKSLGEGVVPTKWKHSILNPIQKVCGTNKCEELRPVNTLPTYEKVLEGIVKQQLGGYTNENEIIIDEQHGFRTLHSCETALNYTIINWKTEMDDGKYVIVVFLDLKRAFETINRWRLLQKLELIGVKGTENQWFHSYLENRTQSTRFNSITSDPLNNDVGLPQGSKLAADLFIIFINDIKRQLRHGKLTLFADDTQISIASHDLQEAIDKINQDLERINEWLNLNKLKINIGKTKYMVLNLRGRNMDDNCIQMGGNIIEKVHSMKYLGFIIDDKLNFHEHVEYLCKKIAKKIGFLSRISNKLNYMDKITVYQTIIAPHFEYCASILFSCTKGDIEKLQVLQNRAMRKILKCHKFTSEASMLEALCWMSVAQRIRYKTMMLVYKIRNNRVPNSMVEHVSYVGDSHKYLLRNNEDFRIKRTMKAKTKDTIFNKGLSEFNNLPSDLKNEKSLIKFKRKLITYVKMN